MGSRRLRSTPWWPRLIDVALAAVLLGIGEWQIHSPDPHRIIANKVFSAVVWAPTAASLVWRRTAPWLVFAIVTLGLTVEALPRPDSGTLAGFVALCVVLYTVARWDGSVERTVAATVIATLTLLFHYSRDPEVSYAQESIQATYIVLLACPLAARVLRRRAHRAASLEDELAEQSARHAEAARAAAAAERARITRELHDVVAHGVSIAIVQAMAAQAALADGKLDEAGRRVGSVEEAARQALGDMRRLVSMDGTVGSEMSAEPQPGLGDLEELVGRLAATGQTVRLERIGAPRALAAGADLALFRVAQEAITNAINHSPGAPVEVRLTYGHNSTEIEVINGAATRPSSGPGSGRGLVGMRERAALYGGILDAGPCESGGYRVHARLPQDQTAP